MSISKLLKNLFSRKSKSIFGLRARFRLAVNILLARTSSSVKLLAASELERMGGDKPKDWISDFSEEGAEASLVINCDSKEEAEKEFKNIPVLIKLGGRIFIDRSDLRRLLILGSHDEHFFSTGFFLGDAVDYGRFLELIGYELATQAEGLLVAPAVAASLHSGVLKYYMKKTRPEETTEPDGLSKLAKDITKRFWREDGEGEKDQEENPDG